MGLLTKIFGRGDGEERAEKKGLPWKSLTIREQLETIGENSYSRPQLVYKHSTTCGISSMVFRLLETSEALQDGKADLYFLDLHAHRDISNLIAENYGVRHQSPQVLVIRNGKVVATASHGGITELPLEKHL